MTEIDFDNRMIKYKNEGITDFYGMSVKAGEVFDATKLGNLSRFMNHSCKPNCHVEKWDVGDKYRIAIFTSRNVQKGEELTFNYKTDWCGANPQPCCCGAPCCSGFLGGKIWAEPREMSPEKQHYLGTEKRPGIPLDEPPSRRSKKTPPEGGNLYQLQVHYSPCLQPLSPRLQLLKDSQEFRTSLLWV